MFSRWLQCDTKKSSPLIPAQEKASDVKGQENPSQASAESISQVSRALGDRSHIVQQSDHPSHESPGQASGPQGIQKLRNQKRRNWKGCRWVPGREQDTQSCRHRGLGGKLIPSLVTRVEEILKTTFGTFNLTNSPVNAATV